MAPLDIPTRFTPQTKKGSVLLGLLILVMVGFAISFFWLSSSASMGFLFAVYMALGVIACLPLPMLGYRFFALNSAYYDMDRNVLTIHWGLRTEIIPIRDIQWIRPVADLVDPLPNPRLTLPGAFLGIRTIEGLGKVEYLADRMKDALMVAAPQVVYVISPEDEQGFLDFYSQGVELGSLQSVRGELILPSIMIGKLWDDQVFRNLVLSGFLIGVAVAIWTILILTSRAEVIFGAQPGVEAEPAPSIRLLLLPVINGLIFLVDVVAGSFFYRREDQKVIAYMVCAGSSLTGILLLAALLLITLSP